MVTAAKLLLVKVKGLVQTHEHMVQRVIVPLKAVVANGVLGGAGSRKLLQQNGKTIIPKCTCPCQVKDGRVAAVARLFTQSHHGTRYC